MDLADDGWQSSILKMRGAAELLLLDWSIFGQCEFVVDLLVAKVDRLASLPYVMKFYVGKTSGMELFKALKSRDDEFKRTHGLNIAIAVYRTRSIGAAGYIETLLINEFREHEKLINRHPGSSGRPPSAPLKYVYVACRMWPAPRYGEFYDINDPYEGEL